ncbi:MAG: hypothetical protein J6A17_01845, partial [Bacilli bacterium]|nr:hypothetical protein [Bacilli bacterium]
MKKINLDIDNATEKPKLSREEYQKLKHDGKIETPKKEIDITSLRTRKNKKNPPKEITEDTKKKKKK